MIHDFVLNFFLYNSEFWGILDSLMLDLDMICVIHFIYLFFIYYNLMARKKRSYNNLRQKK